MDLIKFYADAPDGTLNKYLCYKVKDIENSIDLLVRFKNNGWNVRRAYHHFENGGEVSIKKELFNQEIEIKISDSTSDKLKKTPKM